MILTPKQDRFCQEYQTDFNATQAAIRAGYSKKTAYSIGQENLKKPEIQSKLSELRLNLSNKIQLTQESVLEGYRRLAYYDARKFYDANGNLIQIPDLDDETAFALTGFEVMEEKGGDGKGNQVLLGYTKKIKMSDRRGALDSICKVLGYNAPVKAANTNKDGEDIQQPFTDDQVSRLINSLRENKAT